MSQEIDDVTDIVQIDDPEIDVETIMARIREGLVAHALDQAVEFPTFAIAQVKQGESTRFSEELYYQLEQANLNYDQIWVELSLVEDQLPLVGQFVNRFKRELHRLVVYYVNRLGERQVTMNDALVRTLNALVRHLEDDTAESLDVLALEEKVAALEARLTKLEALVGTDES